MLREVALIATTMNLKTNYLLHIRNMFALSVDLDSDHTMIRSSRPRANLANCFLEISIAVDLALACIILLFSELSVIVVVRLFASVGKSHPRGIK